MGTVVRKGGRCRSACVGLVGTLPTVEELEAELTEMEGPTGVGPRRS